MSELRISELLKLSGVQENGIGVQSFQRKAYRAITREVRGERGLF